MTQKLNHGIIKKHQAETKRVKIITQKKLKKIKKKLLTKKLNRVIINKYLATDKKIKILQKN